MNITSLNAPPNNLHLPDTLNSSWIGNFTTNGILGNHLDDLYQFLRETDWNTSVLPLTIFISILMGMGILGNSLVIVVSLHTNSVLHRGHSASSRLVVLLAVADLMVCLLAMPGQIVRAWYIPWHHDFLCKTWELLRHAVLPTSAVILVAIAYDRYCLICRPTSQLSPAQSRRAFTLTVMVACMMGLVFGVPAMLAVGVNQKMGDREYYLGLCEVNELIMSEAAMKIYWYVLVTFFILVLLLLLITYSAILFSVWKHASFWKRRTKRQATRQTSTIPNSTSTANNAGNFIFCKHRGTKVGTSAKSDKQPKLKKGNVTVRGKQNFALNPYPGNTSESSTVKPQSPKSLSRLKTRKDHVSKRCTCKQAKKESDVFSTDNLGQQSHTKSVPLVNHNVNEHGQDRSSLKATSRDQTASPTPLPTGTQSMEGLLRKTTKRKKLDLGKDSVLFRSCSSVTLPNADDLQSPLRHPQRLPHLVYRRSLPLLRAEQESYPQPIPCCSYCQHHHLHSHQAQQASHPKPKVSTSKTNDRDTDTNTNARRTATKPPIRKQPYRAHVKTAAVFFLVTITFLASYVPTFLMIVRLVPVHPVLYYTYLIHATTNPLLYSAANKNFRNRAKRLFNCCV